MNNKTHVIFGAGPVGLALVDELVEREHQVRAVNRSGKAQMGLFNPTLRELNELLYEFKSDFVAGGEKFSKLFGMKATALDQAISETVAWWK